MNIVNGDEKVTLTCGAFGDDITGGYWERVDDGPLPMQHNTSSIMKDTPVFTLFYLNITSARPMHSGRYRCIAYSEWGIDQSYDITVTITSKRRAEIIYFNYLIFCIVAPPNITKQPTNAIVGTLQPVTFTCEASGFEVKYEWKRHNSNNTIGNQSTLTISRATPLDEDQYYCVAMTEGGYAFSNNVTLTVNDSIIIDEISISMHPRNVTVVEGGTVVLSIDATGSGNLTYEWKKVGSDSLPDTASGGNSTELTITSVTSSDSGSYYCIVMNQGNMVKSNNATVNVLCELAST